MVALAVWAAGSLMVLDAAAVTFTVALTADEEVPPPTLGAAMPGGEAAVSVDTTTGAVTVSGSYSGMTSGVTGAHLHGLAGAGETAGVLIPLNVDGGTSGTISGGGTLGDADLEGLLRGLTYVNVHTSNNGAGELRGQVVSRDVRVFEIEITPEQEVPTPTLGGAMPSGEATVAVQLSTRRVEVAGSYGGLTSNISGSHLHGLAPPGRTAGVLFGLANSGGTSGTISGSGTVSASALSGLLAGNSYVNIHTGNNGAGEIRGQVSDARIRQFEIAIDAQQEVPTPTLGGSAPSGSATVVVDFVSGAISIAGSYAGMTSNVTGAHLHGLAARGATAGVIFGLSHTGGTAGDLSGSSTLSAANLAGLRDGRTYINIHTANNGAGEIRGQIPGILVDDPDLEIARAAGGIVISWDDAARVLVLQESTDLEGWQDSSLEVTEAGGRRQAEVVPARRQFFRLR